MVQTSKPMLLQVMPVAVEPGDRIALFMPGDVLVPFDKGTGQTRHMAGPVTLGQRIRGKDLSAPTDRAYSFGVTGFLQE